MTTAASLPSKQGGDPTPGCYSHSLHTHSNEITAPMAAVGERLRARVEGPGYGREGATYDKVRFGERAKGSCQQRQALDDNGDEALDLSEPS